VHQIHKKIVIVLISFLCIIESGVAQDKLIYPDTKKKVAVAEPSDFEFIASTGNYFVVSDHGLLTETNSKGNKIKQAIETGYDFEGICTYNNQIIVAEESFRKIMIYDFDFNLKETHTLSIHGGRNQGIEGICRNEKRNCFVAVIEKNPCQILELNNEWKVIREVKVPNEISELSSVCFHKGFLYFLSDDEHRVYKLDPENYSILKTWNIAVINPEGITFNNTDQLEILSDDRAMIFTFNLN
jgi:uncharacterized protein YjiK